MSVDPNFTKSFLRTDVIIILLRFIPTEGIEVFISVKRYEITVFVGEYDLMLTISYGSTSELNSSTLSHFSILDKTWVL